MISFDEFTAAEETKRLKHLVSQSQDSLLNLEAGRQICVEAEGGIKASGDWVEFVNGSIQVFSSYDHEVIVKTIAAKDCRMITVWSGDTLPDLVAPKHRYTTAKHIIVQLAIRSAGRNAFIEFLGDDIANIAMPFGIEDLDDLSRIPTTNREDFVRSVYNHAIRWTVSDRIPSFLAETSYGEALKIIFANNIGQIRKYLTKEIAYNDLPEIVRNLSNGESDFNTLFNAVGDNKNALFGMILNDIPSQKMRTIAAEMFDKHMCECIENCYRPYMPFYEYYGMIDRLLSQS